jgi:hypothetical protein
MIASKLPALMDKTTVPRGASNAADEFFDDGEGLGVSLSPAGHDGSPASPGTLGETPSSVRLSGAMIDRSSWVAPVVAVTALVAGVILALVFI